MLYRSAIIEKVESVSKLPTSVQLMPQLIDKIYLFQKKVLVCLRMCIFCSNFEDTDLATLAHLVATVALCSTYSSGARLF